MGNRRVDCILRYIATGAHVVICACFFGQCTTLTLHLIGGLPCSQDDFTNAAHGLTVGCNNRKCSHVVENIFGCNSFASNAALGKGDVFRDGFIKVMTHHQHIKVLFYRVFGKGACWVSRGRQDEFFAANLDDIWGVPAACAFGVKRMNCATFNGVDGFFDKATFVQGICVNHHLNVHLIRNRQTAINRGRSSAPIFVQFERTGSPKYLFLQGGWQRRIPFTSKGKVHWQAICRL